MVSGAVDEGGTPPSKAGGLGRAQGSGLPRTRCQSLPTGPEIPHGQAHAVAMPSIAPSPALSPWRGTAVRQGLRSGLREGVSPQRCSAAGVCAGQTSCSPVRGRLGGSQAPWQHLGALTLLPRARQPPLRHPSGCCLRNGEEKEHERAGSTGLLISAEQSPPSSSGIISLKDKKQHKTAFCAAPSATRGLGAGRPRLLTAFASQGFRRIFHHLQPKEEMSRVYLYQDLLRNVLKKKVCFCREELPQKPQ